MEKIKKTAVGASTIALAIAMGLQTFVFGQSDIKTLQEEVAHLSKRLTNLEAPRVHE